MENDRNKVKIEFLKKKMIRKIILNNNQNQLSTDMVILMKIMIFTFSSKM